MTEKWQALKGRYGWQIHTDKANGKPAPNLNHWIANLKCESCPADEDRYAYLIAAAPEMLEALIAAKEFIESEYRDPSAEPDGEWLAKEARKPHAIICEAIAKAEGAAK